jgi:hypothetical protein
LTVCKGYKREQQNVYINILFSGDVECWMYSLVGTTGVSELPYQLGHVCGGTLFEQGISEMQIWY